MFKLDQSNFVIQLEPCFKALLEREIQKALDSLLPQNYNYLVLNFRDPDYSAETGGYHPVEVMVHRQGIITYITDFSYVGSGYCVELAKDLDFSPTLGIGEQQGTSFSLQEESELFSIFQQNFCNYYHMGVFQLEVTLG